MDFRAQVKRDVVIDMYGYRRLGHNETDEPSFTQPLLYDAIRKRKSLREGYLEHLLKLGGLSREEADEIARTRQEQLEKELSASEEQPATPGNLAASGLDTSEARNQKTKLKAAWLRKG
jgi:2-oxoglutarate dehydrogenase E1 component